MSVLEIFEHSNLADSYQESEACLRVQVLHTSAGHRAQAFQGLMTEPAIGTIQVCTCFPNSYPLKATFEALWVKPGLPCSVCQCSTLTHSAFVAATERTILPCGNVPLQFCQVDKGGM